MATPNPFCTLIPQLCDSPFLNEGETAPEQPGSAPSETVPASPIRPTLAPDPNASASVLSHWAEAGGRAAAGAVHPATPEQELAGAGASLGAAAPFHPPGWFPGVEDRTQDVGGIATNTPLGPIERLVFHRTGSATAQDTFDEYKARIKAGKHVGAHYLIDKDDDKDGRAETYLTVPTDKKVGHAGYKNDKTGYRADYNPNSIGIEMTGTTTNLTTEMNQGGDVLKERVRHLTLAPQFKKRLLGYNEKQLNSAFSGSGQHGGEIYEDITPEQKRALWNLTTRLATTHNLDLDGPSSQPLPGEHFNQNQRAGVLNAHEHVNPKTLGEGENPLEFVKTMRQYSKSGGLIDQFKQRLDTLRASKPTDPKELKRLAEMETQYERERKTMEAIESDRPLAEAMLKPEERAEREGLRRDFYQHFYDRVEALRPPDAGGGARTAQGAAGSAALELAGHGLKPGSKLPDAGSALEPARRHVRSPSKKH